VAEGLAPDQPLAMQKTIDDSLSSLSVEIMADRLSSESSRAWKKQTAGELAATLNDEKVKPAHLHRTYRDFVESEMWGGLNLLVPGTGAKRRTNVDTFRGS
jgi:hypothetical protein